MEKIKKAVSSYRFFTNWCTYALFLLCTFALVLFFGCATQGNKPYILMEKQLADIDNRHRTTAKIIVHSSLAINNREKIKEILKQALQDLRKDDKELDAVIIWAYRNRSELNQTFTLGKLEWAKDKRGWDGKQKLNQEILIETK